MHDDYIAHLSSHRVTNAARSAGFCSQSKAQCRYAHGPEDLRPSEDDEVAVRSPLAKGLCVHRALVTPVLAEITYLFIILHTARNVAFKGIREGCGP